MMDFISYHDMCHHEMEDERLREHLIQIDHDEEEESREERRRTAPSADD